MALGPQHYSRSMQECATVQASTVKMNQASLRHYHTSLTGRVCLTRHVTEGFPWSAM